MIRRMLGLHLLGRPALHRDGAVCVLPIRKSLALLMLLARNPGPVPRSRVVAMLWPSLSEQDGRRNLRRELVRLREAGVGDAVRVDGDALALAGDVSCDADAFDALLEADRPDAALALWRGPPADGFSLGDADAFDDWLGRQREHLSDRRRVALQASARALEACGDLDGALARIDSLLGDDPLQEQQHRDAMRLHSACGRREAALAQYERCRSLLSTELGLTPMAETEALAAGLRGAGPVRAETRLAPTPAVADRPAHLPDLLPFVGRTAEVASLEAVWRSGRPIFIEGEGGVGKTRLATDFAAAHGPYALARCRVGDAEVPYSSFTRALRALAGPTPTTALADVPEWVVTEMARLLPELGASPAPMRSDEERNRFFEACARGWQALASENFDAVVLDDWHHADAASGVLLAYVAKRRTESGAIGARELLLLRPELDEAAAAALASLAEATHAERVHLQPLGGDAVFDLVQRLSGAGNPVRFAVRLERATGGNPFFLAETLRHLAETELLSIDAGGGWQTPFDDATEDYRELPVPASVLQTVQARVRRLSAPARRILESAALASEPFLPSLLAPACALSELEAVLAIEQAVESHLLREHDTGGYAFAHDLVQQAIHGTLSDERRRLVHRRLALGGEKSAAPPAIIAGHHEASGDPRRAVPHRTAAGDEAELLHALPEAAAHWQRALADEPTPGQALALHRRLMRVARLRCELDAVRHHVEAVAALLARGVLTPTEQIDARLSQADALAPSGRAVEALAVLEALAGHLDAAQQGRALATRLVALQALARIDEARSVAQQALALPAPQIRDRIDLLDMALLLESDAGQPQTALGHADAALALSVASGYQAGIARGRFRRGLMLIMLGRLAEAETEMQAAVERCERYGFVHIERHVLINLCILYASQGRHDRALAAAQRGWSLRPALPAGEMQVMFRLAFVDAQMALGDLGAAWEHAAAAIQQALAQNEPTALLASATVTLELLDLLGEDDRARTLLDALAAFEEPLRELQGSIPDLWLALAQFELARGDAGAAGRAHARVDPALIASDRIRVRHAHVAAALALAGDDSVAALSALPDDDAAGSNDELRLRGLALRVEAQARDGKLAAETLAAARTALASPPSHATAALALHRALAEATRLGIAGAPDGAVGAAARYAAELALGLEQHPRQRQGFERHVPRT